MLKYVIIKFDLIRHANSASDVLIFQDLIELHYDFNRSMIVAVSNAVDQNTGIRGKNMTVIYDFVKVSNINDLTRVVISCEIYETRRRLVS